MQTQEAVAIVRALASGTDPDDSQALPADSILRKPHIVVALNRALAALVQIEKRESTRPANAGRYWSRDEVAKIVEEIKSGIEIHQIAKAHNRTVGSIVVKLVKLGKIASPGVPPKAA